MKCTLVSALRSGDVYIEFSPNIFLIESQYCYVYGRGRSNLVHSGPSNQPQVIWHRAQGAGSEKKFMIYVGKSSLFQIQIRITNISKISKETVKKIRIYIYEYLIQTSFVFALP